MQQQIDNLQKQIDELKQSLTNDGMSIELRETMRNEVINNDYDFPQPTTTVTITALGNQVTFPTPLTKLIVLKWKGKEFKIPYYA